MPYRFEKLKLLIPKNKDRRRKLTDEDREEIKHLYGKVSQRKLASMFKVSRRLIIFIGCPEKLARNKETRPISSVYYNRERHKKYMKKHRDYQKSMFGITRGVK